MAAAYLGDGAGVEVGIAGVFALRRIRQKNIFAHDKPAAGDARQQFLLGGAGIGGALQRNHPARLQVRGDALHGIDDIAEVRLIVFAKGRGYADDQSMGPGGQGIVPGGGQPGCHGLFNFPVGDALDVTFAGIQFVHFVFVDVESDGLKTGLGKAQGQRQPHIAESVHGDDGFAGLYFFQQLPLVLRHRGMP